jgi:mono/diheme cytochrome c family protein
MDGRRVFNQSCAACHDVAGASLKSGPVLNGYFRHSPRPAEEHVRAVIQHGEGKMPAFRSLSEHQIEDVVAYLKTLSVR